MLRSRHFASLLSSIVFCAVAGGLAQQRPASDPGAERAEQHRSEQWLTVAPHLPDPETSSPAKLETAGDVLRARRLPDDAIDFYSYALKRGGEPVNLLNKIGVTELEMGRPVLARAYFKRVLSIKRKDAQSWNNLGATEDVAGNLHEAIFDYQRAIKLNKKNALFHANLGTAYFRVRDYDSARMQIETAIRLDPEVFHRGGFGGSQVTVLSADDRGQFAFEMARLAAAHQEEESMLHWLAVAGEAGFDLHLGMSAAKEFEPYRKDARIALIIQNSRTMRTKQIASADPVPALPEAR